MTNQEIIAKVTELKELQRMAEELETEMEALKDQIKADMNEKKVEVMTAGAFKITWKTVASNRFDSKSFKADHADLYKEYTKATESKRFTVA